MPRRRNDRHITEHKFSAVIHAYLASEKVRASRAVNETQLCQGLPDCR